MKMLKEKNLLVVCKVCLKAVKLEWKKASQKKMEETSKDVQPEVELDGYITTSEVGEDDDLEEEDDQVEVAKDRTSKSITERTGENEESEKDQEGEAGKNETDTTSSRCSSRQGRPSVTSNKPSPPCRPTWQRSSHEATWRNVPLSAAPEKYDLDMTPAAFRSWERSMECWLLLCKWPRQEAVHHVRLLCGPALQRALDARFTFDQWSALTQQEALDAIGNLVLRSSSPAVQWTEFFGVSQGQDECVSDYFVRGAQKVNDCAFECPQCSLNLSEYLLLKKLVVGIRDTGLKQQVYQACDSLGSVDALRAMCCAYEAARQHTTGVGGWRESSRAAGTVRAKEDGDQTLDAAAATTSCKTQPSRTCWNCGTLHAPDRASCPAREAVCVACRKKGHFKRCCRSSKRPHGTASANAVSGSVTTAGANVSRQPTIEVTVALGKGAKHRTAAVADTGAQVCVAGAALLSSLNIQPTQLQGRAGLWDVADLPLRCLGSCRCDIYLGGHATQQEVYFVPSARSLFLSLSACKELGLVPAGFPHHSLPTVQAVEARDTTAEPAQPPAKPATIPFPPHEEHVRRLEEWLLQHLQLPHPPGTQRCPLRLPHARLGAETLGGRGESPA
ncbi:hypothetical protein O3P69_017638 [Scylla paramamosain]|uniref:CCHC-type domain-containing protein n=1 Tax=Scylla paramamosain TaxID=85552 RepID=A0AAW0U048_SCYPA